MVDGNPVPVQTLNCPDLNTQLCLLRTPIFQTGLDSLHSAGWLLLMAVLLPHSSGVEIRHVSHKPLHLPDDALKSFGVVLGVEPQALSLAQQTAHDLSMSWCPHALLFFSF